MTNSQFATLMDRFEKLEENFDKRIRRLEVWAGTAAGGIMIAGFVIANDLVRLG